jgi:hypothetical protein
LRERLSVVGQPGSNSLGPLLRVCRAAPVTGSLIGIICPADSTNRRVADIDLTRLIRWMEGFVGKCCVLIASTELGVEAN